MTTTQPTADPCDRQEPHLAHCNWQSDQVGVCPGRPATALSTMES